MFCPKCKYEYKEGITTCPDCGSDMVDELIPEKSEEQKALENENDLVHVFDITDYAELHFIKEILSERKIHYYVRDMNSAHPYKLYDTGTLNAVQVYVEKNKIEEAREILKEIKESETPDERFLDWRTDQSSDELGAETAELCEVSNEMEADVIRGMLDSDGIYSFLRSNILPSSRLTLSFFKPKGFGTIIVNAEELEKAKQVLEDYKKSL